MNPKESKFMGIIVSTHHRVITPAGEAMSTHKSYPFSFTGTGGEYFRIWIVNILLNILTLGLYSAWAKVRTKRWFYGHTVVDGQSFSYLAQPKQLLKGHLIAWAAVVVYALSAHFLPLLGMALLAVLVVASPWLMVAGMRFNARMSAYRGIRFDFTGTVSESYKVNLFWPLLIVPTLGLILPYVSYRSTRFVIDNTLYGSTKARFEGDLKSFQKIYLKVLGMTLLPVALGVAGYFMMDTHPLLGVFMIGAAPFLFYAIMLALGSYLIARLSNLTYSGTYIGEVGFESRLRARSLCWLFISNVFLMGITIGLFYPWARVRAARYYANQMSLQTTQSLEDFSGGQALTAGATGAELADAFDFSTGLL
jgi:uncharacterized membrane protein YjgN (DUF898 family)